ncbi:MAG: GAF domain-containing protein [Chloroflexi bacterium]|nr:GAF domain-containing protein [Chloroflexota bacterium]
MAKIATQQLTTHKPQIYRTTAILINSKLECLSDTPTFFEWLDIPQESATGCEITAVIPELYPHKTDIQHLFDDETLIFTYQNIQRFTPDGFRTYNVRLEKAHTKKIEKALTLTLVDTTVATESYQIPSQNNQQPMDVLRQRNQTLSLLNHAGRILTETLNMEQVLERLLQVTTQIIGAEGSSVWLWDEEQAEWLICRAAFHPGNAETLVDQQVRRGQGVAGWVGQTGKSAIVNKTSDDNRFYPKIDAISGFTTASLLAVPLKLRNQITGVLEVVNKIEKAFTQEDLAIAETLAASASIAIDNAAMVEAMHEQVVSLKARNEELDAFDHTVAHDLQNPLSLIIGFVDLLRHRKYEEISKEERQRALGLIVSNAQKMSNIVHELLLLSSVRKSDVLTQPVEMQDVVDAALMRLMDKIEYANVEINMPDSWPQAWGHAAWVEEVWENYLSNAIKYGGDPPKITIGATNLPDGMVQYWVKDNGRGLRKDEKARLFTPFTRLSDIRVSGHGLGLSIVQRIVEKLDGQVGVVSGPGQGSKFSFTLPAVTDHVQKSLDESTPLHSTSFATRFANKGDNVLPRS